MVEICERLIAYLHDGDSRTTNFMEPVVLIVSRSFTPSDILAYEKSKVQAVVTTSGGKTSHAAILARSYNIPVISGISHLSENIAPGDTVLVDADRGFVYIRPSATVITRFQKQPTDQTGLEELRRKWQQPVYTRDGIKIDVMANISLPDDMEIAGEYGADGIGLVRSEYLLSNRKEMPPIDVQLEYYGSIFKKLQNKHCVIRLMDIGGDKVPQFFDMPPESNPFMGWRAIRISSWSGESISRRRSRRSWSRVKSVFLFDHGAHGDHAPGVDRRQVGHRRGCITAGNENAQMRGALRGAARHTRHGHVPEGDRFRLDRHKRPDPVPQRCRPEQREGNLPLQPRRTRVSAHYPECDQDANDNGMPISICGEMAGNPAHTVLLVGLGLRRFSMIPRNIPLIKEIISHISYMEEAESISHIDAIDSSNDMSRWLKSLNKRLLGDALPKLPAGVEVDNPSP